jgi:hypothetical protein
MKLLVVVIQILVYITRTNAVYSYCDIADGISDMNAAIQGPGTDFGASYATVFRIHGTEKYKSIATQCLQAERILPWQRILLTVKRFLSNQIVATENITVREGVLYPVRKICLKG